MVAFRSAIARWRGKLIYPSRLAKFLSNMSFSLHPGMIRSTKLFYRREIDPRLNPRVGIKSRNSNDLKRHRGGSSRETQSEIWSIQAPNSALMLPTSSINVLESSRNSRPKNPISETGSLLTLPSSEESAANLVRARRLHRLPPRLLSLR